MLSRHRATMPPFFRSTIPPWFQPTALPTNQPAYHGEQFFPLQSQ